MVLLPEAAGAGGRRQKQTGFHQVASGKRKVPTTKPITSNPLFPAVVALWVSACSGLSILAIRPSLLEELVIKSRIDLILPAAAPPLGITARILLALILAALGAVVGAIIARRIARPKPVYTERKRAARGPAAAAEPKVRSRDSHPDAPARRPISAHEELGEESAKTALRPVRRRTLAIDEAAGPFVLHDVVPLPGGRPQILGHDDPEQPDTLDLGEYTEQSELAGEQVDWNAPRQAAPQTSEAVQPLAPPAELPRQVFAPSEAEPATVSTNDAEANALAGRQVFGMSPVEPQDPADRQIFGASANRTPAELVREAGYQASVFEAPAAPPLFADRADGAPAAEPDLASAAALGGIADLGMTDLAHGLQHAMRRRRAAREALRAESAGDAAAESDTAVAPALREPEAAQDDADAPVALPAVATTRAEPVEPVAPFTATEPQPLPAALRPLSFDDFDDDDDDTLASLIPPRHITMSAPTPSTPRTEQPAPAAVAETTVPDPSANDSEDSYASLLTLGQPAALRNPFVRVDEPESDSGEIEPVVIFPGQAPRVPLPSGQTVMAADVAPVVSPQPDEASPFRRFDAPSGSSPGQPIAGAAVAPVTDPEETERALRSALTSLQRISGAA